MKPYIAFSFLAVVLVVAGLYWFWPTDTLTVKVEDWTTSSEGGVSAGDSGVSAIKTDIVGTWQSVDDSKFVREFKQNGTVIDSYEGSEFGESVGTWKLFTDPSREPVSVPDMGEGATYLKIIFSEEALYYTVSEISENSLQMIYLGGNGVLSFKRI